MWQRKNFRRNMPEEFVRFMVDEIRLSVYKHLKELDFAYVTLDILGYRTGSMNETLPAETANVHFHKNL